MLFAQAWHFQAHPRSVPDDLRLGHRIRGAHNTTVRNDRDVLVSGPMLLAHLLLLLLTPSSQA